ncbi:hypothetical protein C8J56DRAFT_1033778 [Mycena floridula]|nr:hypothetical protein C8J56DRAFT_1033778 [Mycena floridula]
MGRSSRQPAGSVIGGQINQFLCWRTWQGFERKKRKLDDREKAKWPERKKRAYCIPRLVSELLEVSVATDTVASKTLRLVLFIAVLGRSAVGKEASKSVAASFANFNWLFGPASQYPRRLRLWLTSKMATTTAVLLSPLQALVNSNQPPLFMEESHFRTKLSEGVEALNDLTQQILETRQRLESLLEQQALKEQELRDYRLVLHPFRRLPKEILSEIFLSFIDEDFDPSDADDTSLDCNEPMWRIPRVCQYWRSLSLGLPRMWSTIRLSSGDFDLTSAQSAEQTQRLYILGVQLQRSASHHLNVSFYHSEPIPKWLQHDDDDDDQPLSAIRSLTMFEFTPRLVSLSGQPHILNNMPLPWAQLTSYDSEEVIHTCRTLVSTVSRMPNLERAICHCCIDQQWDDFESVILPASPVTLPYLRRIMLVHDKDEPDAGRPEGPNSDDCALLSHLTLPGLQHLHVRIHCSTKALENFIERSKCSLKSLHLEIDNTDCLRLLEHIPSVISFTFDASPSITADFTKQLAQNPAILMSLQYLELIKGEDCDITELDLLKAERPALTVKISEPFTPSSISLSFRQ